jgi:hypothetical protein
MILISCFKVSSADLQQNIIYFVIPVSFFCIGPYIESFTHTNQIYFIVNHRTLYNWILNEKIIMIYRPLKLVTKLAFRRNTKGAFNRPQ